MKTHCTQLGLDLDKVLSTYLDEDSWTNAPKSNGLHRGRYGNPPSTKPMTRALGVLGRATTLSHMLQEESHFPARELGVLHF